MINAEQAQQRLAEGNRRFVQGVRSHDPLAEQARRSELVTGQSPFAVVLGCSDSRVPAEVVFDQGLGDLFVIRVAGNIVAPSHVGSVEFAAEQFGTRLVVVLGHTQCGAVQATIDQLTGPSGSRSPNLASIVDRISPAVEPLLGTPEAGDRAWLCREAVRANIRASVEALRHGSAILERLVADDGLRVVGAEYALETGSVEFLDAPVGVARPTGG